MSTAHADHDAGDHAPTDDHAHAFDGEPSSTLPADEPRTPGWVPLLGLALFLTAGIAYLLSSGAPSSDAASAKAEGAAPGANPTPALVRPAEPTTDGQANAAASAAIKMTPEQMKQIQEMLDKMRQQGGGTPVGSAAPAAASAAPSAAPKAILPVKAGAAPAAPKPGAPKPAPAKPGANPAKR